MPRSNYDALSRGSESIDLFIRTYHTLLRSSGEIQVKALMETYMNMNSLLHEKARDPLPDMPALTYTVLRLPPCIHQTRLILLGQSSEVFARAGIGVVTDWTPVQAPGRRRKMFFDGQETVAIYIASPSDVDDVIPLLLGYQLEWNKLHNLLISNEQLSGVLDRAVRSEGNVQADIALLCEGLGLSNEDWQRLEIIWDRRALLHLQSIRESKKSFAVRLLGGSYNDYVRASQKWWNHIARSANKTISEGRPIYFVSSNTHSLVNTLSGYARLKQEHLIDYLAEPGQEILRQEYQYIKAQEVRSSYDNFLYYICKKYMADPRHQHELEERLSFERQGGIMHISSRYHLDVNAQIIELSKLIPERLDPRLQLPNFHLLQKSNALIVNIDYPLGLAAYEVMRTVSYNVSSLRGVYFMGKAATLNARIGDVMISNIIHDEHSHNTYLLNNCFIAQDVSPYLFYTSVLDNQKAVTVKGTFLQNVPYLEQLYQEEYTVIEMEAGPYLSAVYENVFAERYPTGQVVTFANLPFDIGLLHYVSDTPFTRAQNLGSKNLSYYGMEPTYATALAILRRILELEITQAVKTPAERTRRREKNPGVTLPVHSLGVPYPTNLL